MKVITNVTAYRCDYCDKRLWTKHGAKLHEEEYCRKSDIVKKKRRDKINNCKHEFNTAYRYIPGEAVQEPDYDYCIHCGVHRDEVEK